MIYAADKAKSERNLSAALPPVPQNLAGSGSTGFCRVCSTFSVLVSGPKVTALLQRHHVHSCVWIQAALQQNRTGRSSDRPRRPENELSPSGFPHICRVYREQTRLSTKALMTQWKNNFLKSPHSIRDAILLFS